jgi:hypothetical protein
MRQKVLFSFFLSVIVLTISFNDTFGVNVSIQKYPSEIGKSDFEVMVLVEGASKGSNFLRVDLFQEGTTKYFGETYNGSEWYGGSSGVNYFPIEISKDTSASAVLKARVGEASYSKYPAPGDYLMRVRRYTSSGNAASDTQSPVKLKINIPVNTPIPEVKSESTQNERSDPTTPTPTPTPKPTKTPSPKPIKTSTPKPAPEEEKVLALVDEQENEETNIVESEDDNSTESKRSLPLASIFLLVVGVLMLSYGGFYIFRELRVKYKKKNEEKTK